jgi:hypothetical protein
MPAQFQDCAFLQKITFSPWPDRLWMLTFCPKCIIMCHIKGFEMIPRIFERPSTIIDYLFQSEWDLDPIVLLLMAILLHTTTIPLRSGSFLRSQL